MFDLLDMFGYWLFHFRVIIDIPVYRHLALKNNFEVLFMPSKHDFPTQT
jgi:hypothetical protein